MDGTRTTRLAALLAVAAVALALVVATVLATGQRVGPQPDNTVSTLRTPGAVPGSGAPVTPRTTPPPTFPVSGGVDVGGPRGTLAASNADQFPTDR